MKPNVHYKTTVTLKGGEAVVIGTEYVSAEAYIAFLRRSDLGQQYPKEDFQQRVATLVESVQISLIARNAQSQIVGVCLGLTDFAYWLMITDLGTDRDYAKQGLGKALMEIAHELAGGTKNIVVFAYANENAVPFYEKIGMRKTNFMMIKDQVDYTEFVVA